jgi:hypothetical protein
MTFESNLKQSQTATPHCFCAIQILEGKAKLSAMVPLFRCLDQERGANQGPVPSRAMPASAEAGSQRGIDDRYRRESFVVSPILTLKSTESVLIPPATETVFGP